MPQDEYENVIKGDKIKIATGIVLKFFIFYLIFFLIYEFLMKQGSPDFITKSVAAGVDLLYHWSGYETYSQVMEDGRSIGIFMSGNRWVVKVVEGCNGMSVIILSLAFVLSVPVRWRRRLAFALFSSVVIFLANLLRIYILGLIYISHSGWFDFAHRVLFPASIYALAVLLWFVYVRKAASDEIVNK